MGKASPRRRSMQHLLTVAVRAGVNTAAVVDVYNYGPNHVVRDRPGTATIAVLELRTNIIFASSEQIKVRWIAGYLMEPCVMGTLVLFVWPQTCIMETLSSYKPKVVIINCAYVNFIDATGECTSRRLSGCSGVGVLR